MLNLVFGLVVGTVCIHLMIKTILSPERVGPTEYIVRSVLFGFQSWISEAILVLRVLVVLRVLAVCYPRHNPKIRMAVFLAFPVTIKAVRAAISIVLLHQWGVEAMHANINSAILITKFYGPWFIKASWILEIFDNGYMSGLFLWQLNREGHIFNGASIGRVPNESEGSFSSRMRALFWIASTNFIFPLIFNLVQIILIFVTKDLLLVSSIQAVNVYVCVIATVFATVWSSTSSFKDRRAQASLQKNTPLSPIVWRQERQTRDLTITHASSDRDDPSPHANDTVG